MSEGLISVIIPVYNAGAYLQKCLDSIIGQTYKNLEVILVGLMNTTYGMEIKVNDDLSIPFGDVMDEAFGLLNAYIAAYPTVQQANGNFHDFFGNTGFFLFRLLFGSCRNILFFFLFP